MFVTGEWSRLSHATWGGGSPLARHATTAPELLVKVITLGGGSTSTGPAGALVVRTEVAAPANGKRSFALEFCYSAYVGIREEHVSACSNSRQYRYKGDRYHCKRKRYCLREFQYSIEFSMLCCVTFC